jgi:hypothetical protein
MANILVMKYNMNMCIMMNSVIALEVRNMVFISLMNLVNIENKFV